MRPFVLTYAAVTTRTADIPHSNNQPTARRVAGPCERYRYTRRRFGGRHPLCGMGVTSLIDVMVKPDVESARSADSRPEPGPFTKTSSVFTPCSWALRAASSDAICAAYGVDLRLPLNAISGRGPRNRVALNVGNRHHRIVVRRVHMRDARRNILSFSAPNARCCGLGHRISSL